MKNFKIILIIVLILFTPLAHASVESALSGLKIVLLGSILPIFAVLGLGFAAFSFFTGNPNAKQQLIYALTGSVIFVRRSKHRRFNTAGDAMKNCPTSNMNRSKFWGFEVIHIVSAFFALAASNVLLNVIGAPLILSWVIGIAVLAVLRFISHGQKNGHLELLFRFVSSPRLFLGHTFRGCDVAKGKCNE